MTADAVADTSLTTVAGTNSIGLGSVAVQSVAIPTTKPRSSVLVDASHVVNVSVMVLASVRTADVAASDVVETAGVAVAVLVAACGVNV